MEGGDVIGFIFDGIKGIDRMEWCWLVCVVLLEEMGWGVVVHLVLVDLGTGLSGLGN